MMAPEPIGHVAFRTAAGVIVRVYRAELVAWHRARGDVEIDYPPPVPD